MALNGVGVGEAAELHILFGGVVYGAVPRELVADLRIDLTLVSHQVRFAAGVLDDDRAQRLCRHIGDMEATRLAATLDQGDDGHLADRTTARMLPLAGVFVLLLAADVRLISFDNLVLTADPAPIPARPPLP